MCFAERLVTSFLVSSSHLDGLLHITVGISIAVIAGSKLCTADIAILHIGELTDKVVNQLHVAQRIERRCCHKERELSLAQICRQCFLNARSTIHLIIEAQPRHLQTVSKESADGIAQRIVLRHRLLHQGEQLSFFVKEWHPGTILRHRHLQGVVGIIRSSESLCLENDALYRLLGFTIRQQEHGSALIGFYAGNNLRLWLLDINAELGYVVGAIGSQ